MNRLFQIVGRVEIMVSISYCDRQWQVLVGSPDGHPTSRDKYLETFDRHEAVRVFKRECKELAKIGHCVMQID